MARREIKVQRGDHHWQRHDEHGFQQQQHPWQPSFQHEHAGQETPGPMHQVIQHKDCTMVLQHQPWLSNCSETVKLAALGPCFAKFLLSNVLAGAILGKGGAMHRKIAKTSRVYLQMSLPEQTFPGTLDRMCIIGGDEKSLGKCMELILKRMDDIFSNNKDKSLMIRLVVPNSCVSRIIGPGGSYVSKLRASTGCCITASSRVPSMMERLILISGTYSCLVQTVQEVLKIIQLDPHLQEHLRFSYDGIDLPLWIWARPQAQKPDVAVPLISPSHIKNYTKRQLLEYLCEAALRETMLRHQLSGSVKNLLKSKGMSEVAAAVTETWQLRCGGACTICACSAQADTTGIEDTAAKSIEAPLWSGTVTSLDSTNSTNAHTVKDVGVVGAQKLAMQWHDTGTKQALAAVGTEVEKKKKGDVMAFTNSAFLFSASFSINELQCKQPGA